MVEEVVEVVVEEDSNGGMIAGIVVGFLVIIGLAVGGFFLWKRRKNRQETEGGDPKVAKVLPTVDGVEMKLNAAETKLGSTKKQDLPNNYLRDHNTIFVHLGAGVSSLKNG